MDLEFFNKVKSLFVDAGYSWHEENEEGFLWCDEDRGTGVAWIFYLYADCLKVILGFNGYHTARTSLNERTFFRLYRAAGGKGASLQDITKKDLVSMKGHLFELARIEIQKMDTGILPKNVDLNYN